jgi:LDH2 family malate/lactate/ureidoglycolate dehydrogenase
LMDTAAMDDGGEVFYPGQQSWLRRRENRQKGIPVDRELWALIKEAAV